MSTTTTPNPQQESFMDTTASPRPVRRLTSADRRAAREAMDAKIASFEQLGGISSRTREVLDLVDEQVEAEWRISRRAARANRLASSGASLTRGGV